MICGEEAKLRGLGEVELLWGSRKLDVTFIGSSAGCSLLLVSGEEAVILISGDGA